MSRIYDKMYVNHIKDVLRCYFHLKDTYKMLLDENNELNDKIDRETLPKGISYDREPSGVSTVNPTPYINELILSQASVEKELYMTERRIRHLEKDYKIKEMLSCLSADERSYFDLMYVSKLTTSSIAKVKGCSQQNAHKRCEYVIRKMASLENNYSKR